MFDPDSYEKEIIRIAENEIIDKAVLILELTSGFNFNREYLVQKILDLKGE